MQYLKYLLIVAVLSVLTACGHGGPGRPGDGDAMENALTAGLNGTTVTRSMREPLMLTLVKNTKLGGDWKVVSCDYDIIEFMDMNPRRYNKVMVGPLANLMYCDWMLRAKQPGTANLKMEYVSDDGSEVYETFQVTVVIKEKD
jgi:hypothetical protein